jgi:predicted nucleotidyltransferase component of viral defense system
MTHWTKHESRLQRDFGRKHFGDEGYAREELVGSRDLVEGHRSGDKRIADAITRGMRGAQLNGSQPKGETCTTKLILRADDAQIKIEVTPVLRGCVYEPAVKRVAPKVEEQFGFAEMPLVHVADLYAGKIMAALDRQHPRDLFHVRDLLANEGIDETLRKAIDISAGREEKHKSRSRMR